jgi:hypothetical protein
VRFGVSVLPSMFMGNIVKRTLYHGTRTGQNLLLNLFLYGAHNLFESCKIQCLRVRDRINNIIIIFDYFLYCPVRWQCLRGGTVQIIIEIALRSSEGTGSFYSHFLTTAATATLDPLAIQGPWHHSMTI